MPRVRFHPNRREVEVAAGESLLRAAILAGVHVNATCGGSGVCGKCRVVVESGAVASEPSAKITPEQVAAGHVLACTSTVTGDVEVRVPGRVPDGGHPRRPGPRAPHGHARVGADPEGSRRALRRLRARPGHPPPVRRAARRRRSRTTSAISSGCAASWPAPTASASSPSTTRAWRSWPARLRAGEWKVTATLTRGGEGECPRLIGVAPGDRSARHYGLAVDIGTTSVVAELVDLATRATLGRESEYNAQISCGDDVISRIVYSMKKDGLARLQGLVAGTINTLVDRLVEKTGVERDDIVSLVAAGNTTMIHLFYGIDPRHIRAEPYIPTMNFIPTVEAATLGLRIAHGARVYCVPGRASYVGGDITAGLLASGVFRSDKLTLFIDIGTNGEMALGNAEWLLSCACSAGPAFEGGSVKHGMRAVMGAIETVRINPDTLEPMIVTIGQQRAKGICGSGLIDAVAELFLTGVINEKGKFNLDLGHPRIRVAGGMAEYVLVPAAESAIGADIAITEADLDNLIRTKGAIYAGIATLLEQMEMTVDAIEQVYIGGGFGRYLELDQAITIGLLPEVAEEKVKYVGNSSLLGAHLVLLSQAARESGGRDRPEHDLPGAEHQPRLHGQLRVGALPAAHGSAPVPVGPAARHARALTAAEGGTA